MFSFFKSTKEPVVESKQPEKTEEPEKMGEPEKTEEPEKSKQPEHSFEEGQKILKETIEKLTGLGYTMVKYEYEDDNTKWNEIASNYDFNNAKELWDKIIENENHCILFEKTIKSETIQVIIKYKVYSADDHTNYYNDINGTLTLKTNEDQEDSVKLTPQQFIEKSNENVAKIMEDINKSSEEISTTTETPAPPAPPAPPATTAGKRKTIKRKKHRKTRK
jgi:hypothetical protein